MYHFSYSRNLEAYVIYNPNNEKIGIKYSQEEARALVQRLNDLFVY